MQHRSTLMKNKNSILLPSTFFNSDIKAKIEKLNSSKLDTVYLFDHTVNPVNRSKDVYKLLDGFEILNSYLSEKKNIGSCILNINSRNKYELTKNYIEKFIQIKNFKLGLGIGDLLYESTKKFKNKLDGIIEEIISNKSNKLGSIFLGGNSQIILEASRKYSLGINQWLGTNDQFQKKLKLYKEIKKPKGSLSRCIGLNHINHELDFIDYEKIFIFKDTNTEKFLETVDIIFK